MDSLPPRPRAPRVPFIRSVLIGPSEDLSSYLKVSAENISRGGMFIRSSQSVPPGARISVALEARGKTFPFARGVVAWKSHDDETRGFGLRFTHLKPRAKALIDHLVASGGSVGRPEPVDTEVPEPPPSSGDSLVIRWALEARSRVRPLLGAAFAAGIGFGAGVFATLNFWNPPAVDITPPPARVEVHEPTPPIRPVVMPPLNVASTVARSGPERRPWGRTRKTEFIPVGPGEFLIPSGAIQKVAVSKENAQVTMDLTLDSEAAVEHFYRLPDPPRLVVDVLGPQPDLPAHLEGDTELFIERLRTGHRPEGTRLVFDLLDDPACLRRRGQRIWVAFEDSPDLDACKNRKR